MSDSIGIGEDFSSTLDTKICRLSQPLVAFLQERDSAVPLDPLSSQCLVGLKSLIEKTTLHSAEEQHPQMSLSLSSQTKGSPAVASLKKVGSAASRSFKVRVAPLHTKISSLSTTRRKREITIFHTKESIPESILQLQLRASGQRLKKRRALVAVFPYTEISEEEGSETLLLSVFGMRFARWWYRWKQLHSIVFWLSALCFDASTYIYLLRQSTWRSTYWLAIAHALSMIHMTIGFSSVSSAHLVKCCLRTYEGIWIMTELFSFGLSFWAVACFRWQDIGIPVSSFLVVGIPFVFYDSYPVSVRLKVRLALLIGFCLTSSCVALLYARSFKNSMCFYRMDLEQGFVNEVDIANGSVTLSRWNLSLFDFCINRGITLITLLFRIVYSSYRHPSDCIILKSRVRLVETTVRDTAQSSRGTMTTNFDAPLK